MKIECPAAKDVFKVNWILTRRCNYKCSYCCATKRNMEYTLFENLKLAVDKIVKNPKRKSISLTGGEPTLHPEIARLVEYILKHDNTQIRKQLYNYTEASMNMWDGIYSFGENKPFMIYRDGMVYVRTYKHPDKKKTKPRTNKKVLVANGAHIR